MRTKFSAKVRTCFPESTWIGRVRIMCGPSSVQMFELASLGRLGLGGSVSCANQVRQKVRTRFTGSTWVWEVRIMCGPSSVRKLELASLGRLGLARSISRADQVQSKGSNSLSWADLGWAGPYQVRTNFSPNVRTSFTWVDLGWGGPYRVRTKLSPKV